MLWGGAATPAPKQYKETLFTFPAAPSSRCGGRRPSALRLTESSCDTSLPLAASKFFLPAPSLLPVCAAFLALFCSALGCETPAKPADLRLCRFASPPSGCATDDFSGHRANVRTSPRLNRRATVGKVVSRFLASNSATHFTLVRALAHSLPYSLSTKSCLFRVLFPCVI